MKRLILTFLIVCASSSGERILIPMDLAQKDHLKAYGIAYWILTHDINVEWLLNFRGGSFMLEHNPSILKECRVRGVTAEVISDDAVLATYTKIDANNMEIVLLEKTPKIAIYTPPNRQPWDDAVTLALTYAEVDYETLWDEEVFLGHLDKYDWLHLHHEDFTGQYGKFYRNYHNAPWYVQQQEEFEAMAQRLGFPTVSEEKKAVALKIKNYVGQGGFLFAMCSATDSYDIALAAEEVDIVESVFDGTPADLKSQQKLDFTRSFAFHEFEIITDPFIYEFSNIDIPSSDRPITRGAEADYFTLFEFSAKYDPVPAMLTQNHVAVIKGFMGQTTGFRRSTIKQHILIMGEVEEEEQVKYIHGNFGRGTFTFLGGHDPEDYQHFVGDPPTDLSLHRNSPGYRLILNNVLFPAARKKERKT
ncbi:MAG: asparagine synthetase B [Candidatus Marinimicrobia bacterium]|nr:asparagine synthetase B [Candidatus Neomarinimicrobiota bacterium]MDP6593108.1 asparagine synthetase B [Candidatus Neomarinimicrobiota bacterium]MDP6836799.1 asparagine synthetase B [Candidatus Neomarinimicrobiota bacterium]MDP6965777.1 asparagine synthetase B [Candidatus Neomarinimicrobiota bacterium]